MATDFTTDPTDAEAMEAEAYSPDGTATSLDEAVGQSKRFDLSTEVSDPLTSWELILCAGLAAGWLMIFCFGVFIPTLDYRQALWANETSFMQTIGYSLLVMVCYTLTNIGFLSCFAAILGSMTRRWYVSENVTCRATFTAIPASRCYASAFLRGFFLYLFFIAGFLAMTTQESVINTALDQYVRIAGIVSVLAFTIGYDPAILYRLIGRVVDFTDLGERPQN